MKLHVQCDRCRKYAPVRDEFVFVDHAREPLGWFQLRAFGSPAEPNVAGLVGPVDAVFCGECMPVVRLAVEAVKSHEAIKILRDGSVQACPADEEHKS